ncbi:MAG: hypothetical protein J6P58_05355 [Oscillospiraceae bacterium]|nr:hypothetical protein [Oscillospiraceae bacterium]
MQSDEHSSTANRSAEVAKTFTSIQNIGKTADLYGLYTKETKIGIVQGGEMFVLSIQAVDFRLERQYHGSIKSEQIRITKNEREAKLYES